MEGRFFLNALFLRTCFHESDITCIITVVGAQEQHKAMFLKHKKRGGGQKIPNTVIGGAISFPCILEGGHFFLPIDFGPISVLAETFITKF